MAKPGGEASGPEKKRKKRDEAEGSERKKKTKPDAEAPGDAERGRKGKKKLEEPEKKTKKEEKLGKVPKALHLAGQSKKQDKKKNDEEEAEDTEGPAETEQPKSSSTQKKRKKKDEAEGSEKKQKKKSDAEAPGDDERGGESKKKLEADDEKPEKKTKGLPLLREEISKAANNNPKLFRRYVSLLNIATIGDKQEKVEYICELLEKVYKRHRNIIRPFKNLSPDEAQDLLSDPSRSIQLRLPCMLKSQYGPPSKFTFVGRRVFKSYPKLITIRRTSVGGYPGRGKSYLMAAMACYLHTYEQEHGPVVYIQATELVGDLSYLVEALLLAYVRHPDIQLQILACGSELQLLRFCKERDLLVFLDEANAFDVDKKKAGTRKEDREAASAWRNQFHQRGPSCSSYNSDSLPDNVRHTLRVDKPFDLEELAGWLSSRGLDAKDFWELTYHTGFVPRLLEQYTQDKESYISDCQRELEKYLEEKVVSSAEQESARSVLNGEVRRLGTLDPGLFFESDFGSKTVVNVLPFLVPQMQAYLDRMREKEVVVARLDAFVAKRKEIQHIMMDASLAGVQPVASLNGWLAERITRDCILLQRKCLDTQFGSTTVFSSVGGKVVELDGKSAAELQVGICFVPEESNAADADLHVVKLNASQDELQVHSFQMSVSTWREKKRKQSHIEWRKKVAVLWSGNWRVKADFTYILSNALTGEVDIDVQAAVSVRKKKFSEVHRCLSFIDDLKSPEMSSMRCMGNTKEGGQCERVGYTQQQHYYCYQHKGQQQ